jgi:hypothetical protein
MSKYPLFTTFFTKKFYGEIVHLGLSTPFSIYTLDKICNDDMINSEKKKNVL